MIRNYNTEFLKTLLQDSKPVEMSYSDFDLSNTVAGNTGSFKYDPLGYPLKSTQQLNLDWSKFENHTFFSSAEVKVNEAFNRIINGYPFDGTKKEVESFLDSLTGFEKWVFDRFPRWSGALHFSGTQTGELGANGTWISVKDKTGNMFPALSKNNKGITVINPGDDDSFTIESLIFVPNITNDTQVVFQKQSSQDSGYTLYLKPSSSTNFVTASFNVCSGSSRNYVEGIIQKGKYNHICVSLNKEDAKEGILQFYVNEKLESESSNLIRFKKINADNSDFLIGSGSSFYSMSTLVVPNQTFSGSMDELRVFHSTRDAKHQKLYSTRGLYSTPDLRLYFRFNEPSGSLSLNGNNSIESIVLDSSGNSLHSNVNNFKSSLRLNVAEDDKNVLVNESNEFNVVLFPAYKDVLDLNEQLLITASSYDKNNPNNILRLVPQHYLLEGASQDGFSTIEGDGGNPYGGDGIPGQGKKGSVQIILSFLYIWSKFFDEIKAHIDSFATLKTVGYDPNETVPDNFLNDLVKEYGFNLPPFFSTANLDQFIEGKEIDQNDLKVSLKKIQSIILRRVLKSVPEVIRSKGTQHSIRTFLRSVGIDPDNSLRIREYGGPTTKQLTTARETKMEFLGMADFQPEVLLTSDFLSASRIEPGYPEPMGTFLRNSQGEVIGTTEKNDGLLTSGSWNLEALFKIPPQKLSLISDSNKNQSLLRMFVTGSNGPGLVANVVATQFVEHPESPAKLYAFIRPGMDSTSPLLTLTLDLDGKGIFDGDRWNVSIGCIRNDEINSTVSSSYYLRAGKTQSTDIVSYFMTSSYFYEEPISEGNVFRKTSSTFNASGSFICIGNNQTIPFGVSSAYKFLNNYYIDDLSRTKDFIGWASGLRFWSKSMDEIEWKEHVRNPKSVGVNDPYINYNFTKNISGSFQKLRMDCLHKQEVRSSDSSGNITFLDFSQNNNSVSGSGFDPETKVLVGDVFIYNYLSPYFDESATDDKIRIRSFEEESNLNENPWAVPAPSFLSNDMFIQEEPQDDLRLSIEFSMVDSLDRDMISMFSSFDALGQAIGSPELMFSPDYPDLENLRDVYFNRLSGKPEFKKFLEFYRWFDTSISSFIYQIIPSKTLYKGSNFVIESHILERHKNIYRHSSNYAGRGTRLSALEQFEGNGKKY